MENTKEKLEISQWLHEKGLEPDFWVTANYLGSLSLSNWHTEYNLDKKPDQPAWFSLERVLKLLPSAIHADNDEQYGWYDLLLTKNLKGYKVFYFSELDHDTLEDMETWSENCPHLAALKLLKKVIEIYGMEAKNGK